MNNVLGWFLRRQVDRVIHRYGPIETEYHRITITWVSRELLRLCINMHPAWDCPIVVFQDSNNWARCELYDITTDPNPYVFKVVMSDLATLSLDDPIFREMADRAVRGGIHQPHLPWEDQ